MLMKAIINHVSVLARDLDESVAFYRDVFEMESVATPNFDVPVRWLQCGDVQLHLFKRDVEPPSHHHFGITVSNFEAVYRHAVETNCFANWSDSTTSSLYELPDGGVQMYLYDPAGNIVEVDWPDIETLPEEIQTVVTDRNELIPQTGEAAQATLNLTR